MNTLTARQKNVLSFIEGYIASNKYPPNVREISSHFGVAVNATHGHLKALIKKGYIQRKPHAARGIVVVNSKLPDLLTAIEKHLDNVDKGKTLDTNVIRALLENIKTLS